MVTKNSPSSSKTKKTKKDSLHIVEYSKMRKNHKRKFRIGGSPYNYLDIIHWLRFKCSSEGSVFKGIPSLNSRGYPLVQIKVINAENKYVKFIIRKHDLYLIAFTSTTEVGIKKGSSRGKVAHGKGTSKVDSKGKSWFQFDCGYQIDDWQTMHKFEGSYKGVPGEETGLDCMNEAVNVLNHKKSSWKKNAKACEVFFFHLCEAARFRPIEFIVYRSLGGNQFDWSGINDEGENNHLLNLGDEEEKIGLDGIPVCIEKDIYSLFEAAGDIHSVSTQKSRLEYLENLVGNYSDLSQLLYAYSFSGKAVVGMESDRNTLSKLYMRSAKSLRFTIGVLCRLSEDKLLPALEEEVTRQKYESIKSKIEKLRRLEEI